MNPLWIFWCVTAFSVVALLIALLFGRHISRLIVTSVGEMLESAEQSPRGDINCNITVDAEDEIGELALAHKNMVAFIQAQAETIQAMAHGNYTRRIKPRDDLDVMTQSIAKLISQNGMLLNAAQKVSKGIYTISRQVADTSQKLAEGVSGQAGEVENLSLLLEQVLEEAENNEKNAGENAEDVRLLDDSIVNSNRYIEEMKLAMDDILNRSTDLSASAS